MLEKSIRLWLIEAARALRNVGIDSGRLDAEIILAHTLRTPRTYLHAHLDETITPARLEIANARLQLRLERTPIAYIIGHKEFYGRRFKVTPATLIPRPETETLVELFLKYSALDLLLKYTVDVGTGCGCIGITIKLERPSHRVLLADMSTHALAVASQNAAALDSEVTVQKSDLLKDVPYPTLDYIVANLPYVDPSWQRSEETNYEPTKALFANDNGLYLIKRLIEQSADRLAAGGMLFLEADPRQHKTIVDHAQQHSLVVKEIQGYAIALSHL